MTCFVFHYNFDCFLRLGMTPKSLHWSTTKLVSTRFEMKYNAIGRSSFTRKGLGPWGGAKSNAARSWSCSKLLKPQSHGAYDQVTIYLRPKHVWSYVLVPPVAHDGTTSCGWSRIGSRTIDRTIGRTMLRLIYDRSSGATIDRPIGRRVPRLIVRSVVGRNDWSCDRSLDTTIDRTIGRRVPRLLVRSVVAGCNDWSYARSQDVTIDRTIGRRTWRLIVRSVVGGNDWSYICRW